MQFLYEYGQKHWSEILTKLRLSCTGSTENCNKTYTACNICYRLIKFAGAKRILFLVDRNNLGRQTVNEFQQFDSPYSQYKFTEEYNVQHLRKNNIDSASKVVITTIQRLYSILKGEPDYDDRHQAAVRALRAGLVK